MSEVLEAALRYLDLGLSVIPIKAMAKTPDLTKWQPYQKRRPTREEVKAWFEEPGQNVAVVCGAVSGGLVVLDYDDPRAFRYSWPKGGPGGETLENETLVAETSRGVHVYIHLKGGEGAKSRSWRRHGGAKRFLPLDFQGEGRYAVAPPSIHPSGKAYRFLGEARKLLEVSLRNLEETIDRRAEEWPAVSLVLDAWTEGNRHQLTLGLAKVLRYKFDFGEERVEDIVRRLCAAAGDEEVQDRLRAVRDTLRKGPEETAARGWLGEGIYGALLALFPKRKGKKQEDETRYLTFAELPDGRFAEEILTAEGEAFMLYDPARDEAETVPELRLDGEIVKPLPVDETLRRGGAIILPDGVEEYGSTRDLLDEMEALALEVFDPGKETAMLQMWARGGLVSWILGPLFEGGMEKYASIFPTLGPSESGKGRLLSVCRFWFYRSLFFLKTTRVPSLFRAIAPWSGTLVLDEADIRNSMEAAEFVQFLNARAVGSVIPRFSTEVGDNVYFLSFGNTALAIRRPYSDDGFNSRSVPLRAEATPKNDLPLLPPREWAEKGRTLQRKLLLWRFRHLAKIQRGELRVPTYLDIPGVRSFRVREAFLVLRALGEEEPRLIEDMEAIAQELDRRLVAERAAAPEGLILNVVYGVLDDDGVEVAFQETAYRIDRIIVPSQGEERGPVQEPLTLRYVSDALGKAFSPSQISAYWRGLGQEVKPQVRLGKRKWRGALLVKDVPRLDREFSKYVVGAESKIGVFPTHPLEKFTREGLRDIQRAGTGSTGGTDSGAQAREVVPLVPAVPPRPLSVGGSPQNYFEGAKRALIEEEAFEVLRNDPKIVPKFLTEKVLRNLLNATVSGGPVPPVAFEGVHHVVLKMREGG